MNPLAGRQAERVPSFGGDFLDLVSIALVGCLVLALVAVPLGAALIVRGVRRLGQGKGVTA